MTSNSAIDANGFFSKEDRATNFRILAFTGRPNWMTCISPESANLPFFTALAPILPVVADEDFIILDPAVGHVLTRQDLQPSQGDRLGELDHQMVRESRRRVVPRRVPDRLRIAVDDVRCLIVRGPGCPWQPPSPPDAASVRRWPGRRACPVSRTGNSDSG